MDLNYRHSLDQEQLEDEKHAPRWLMPLTTVFLLSLLQISWAWTRNSLWSKNL